MKGKMWIVFLIGGIACALAAGYLLSGYLMQAQEADRTVDGLRALKRQARSDASETETAAALPQGGETPAANRPDGAFTSAPGISPTPTADGAEAAQPSQPAGSAGAGFAIAGAERAVSPAETAKGDGQPKPSPSAKAADISATQPEPAPSAKAADVSATQSEPSSSAEAADITATQPEPASSAKAADIAASQSEPSSSAEATDTSATQPEPAPSAKAADTSASQPKSSSSAKTADITASQPEPAPSAKAADVLATQPKPSPSAKAADIAAPQPEETSSAKAADVASAAPVATALPSPTPFVLTRDLILTEYQELYDINPELIGWLIIDGTVIDYPVMQSAHPDYYLTHDFYGNKNSNGTLVMDAHCDVYKPSRTLLIHGHNMKNGKMFKALLSYASESFGMKHQTIRFDTLVDHREYQLVAAFYSRLYEEDSEEEGFRYYVNVQDANSAAYFTSGLRSERLYDTGVDFGVNDEYIVLSTCSYHVTDGRFVVVGKRVD